MVVSFAADIRPLFRDSPDVDSMKDFGLDLSSYDDVRAKAGAILARLKTVACPVMALGQRSNWHCSNNGWRKVWRPKPADVEGAAAATITLTS